MWRKSNAGVCVCVLSQVGADRPAGKQAGWSLISPVRADSAAPAGLLQRKRVLYVMLEGQLCSTLCSFYVLFFPFFSCLFSTFLTRSVVFMCPALLSQVHSGKHPGNKGAEGKGIREGKAPQG